MIELAPESVTPDRVTPELGTPERGTPEDGTVERWAWDYIVADTLSAKLEPGAVPERWEDRPPIRRLRAAGRPAELRAVARAKKIRGLGAPAGRARAMHTFFHHELQAAELMAWAVLAFPDTPHAFRAGLLRIARDEIRHMHLYAAAIERLGHHIGEFEVRDWFWQRVPTSPDPAAFLAVMGLGVESANLEHTRTYAARFRALGDEQSAQLQERVGREEIAHARFAARWFARFAGGLTWERWLACLTPPLTPLLMRGKPLDREARRRAGQTEAFLDELDAWLPGDSSAARASRGS
jgi:uncharacterized ferritin-like protein (DUF455 family)